MPSLKDIIWGYFPHWYHQSDTYKDGNGKGLFQRYLEAFGNEWDEELLPKLEDIRDTNDVLTVNSDLLRHLSWFLGNPPDMVYHDAKYRLLLRYLHGINKYKGNEEGYKRIFAILGISVTLIIHELTDYRYDNPELNYDDNQNLHRYDSECPSCTDYSIQLNDDEGYVTGLLQGDYASGTQLIINILMAMIKYVEPINMRLRDLTWGEDPIPNDIPWVLTTGVWDDSLRWHDRKFYRDNPD